MAIDKVGVRFAIMRLRLDSSGLDGVLGALGNAIGAVEARIDDIADNADPDDRDLLIGDACDLIESLLGTAFIACQTQITGVVSAGVQLASQFQGGDLPTDLPSTKDGILAIGKHVPCVPGVTYAALVDALANYFKHRDEWQGDWEEMTGRGGKTAKAILASGLSQGSTGNLRRGFEVLTGKTTDEIKTYRDVFRLSDSLSEWAEEVHQCCRTALGR